MAFTKYLVFFPDLLSSLSSIIKYVLPSFTQDDRSRQPLCGTNTRSGVSGVFLTFREFRDVRVPFFPCFLILRRVNLPLASRLPDTSALIAAKQREIVVLVDEAFNLELRDNYDKVVQIQRTLVCGFSIKRKAFQSFYDAVLHIIVYQVAL